MAHYLHLGDNLTFLRGLPADSIHCCVTDPPYGLRFMGKRWDYDVPSVELWREVLRVLKPGGTLLSFAGARTQHRMAVNIEDAGFKLCDMLLWLYGQGFPKGQRIDKLIDDKLGATREVVGVGAYANRRPSSHASGDGSHDYGFVGNNDTTAPATDAAKQWDGWKTHALKPAYEPIIMAMKPNDGNYANNALAHGVAGLHIDACRVPGEAWTRSTEHKQDFSKGVFSTTETHRKPFPPKAMPSGGRYPANLLHDGSDEVLAGFPETEPSRAGRQSGKCIGYGGTSGSVPRGGHTDTGTAARFFYCAKARKADRGEGNTHPTVKPLALMRWLVRLVAPIDGIVLDPFMGSGTTGVACQAEGFEFLGLELDPGYHAMAMRRLN